MPFMSFPFRSTAGLAFTTKNNRRRICLLIPSISAHEGGRTGASSLFLLACPLSFFALFFFFIVFFAIYASRIFVSAFLRQPTIHFEYLCLVCFLLLVCCTAWGYGALISVSSISQVNPSGNLWLINKDIQFVMKKCRQFY